MVEAWLSGYAALYSTSGQNRTKPLCLWPHFGVGVFTSYDTFNVDLVYYFGQTKNSYDQ